MADKPADFMETAPEPPAEDTEELIKMHPSGRGPFSLRISFWLGPLTVAQ